MPAKSIEDAKKILEKDFSEKVADDLLNMIDKLVKENIDNDKIEEEINQHLLHHIEKDVKAAVKSARTGVHGFVKVGTLSGAKRKQ